MNGPAQNVYDVIVIGAGPVGYTVAGQTGAAGLCFPSVSELWLRLLETDRTQARHSPQLQPIHNERGRTR